MAAARVGPASARQGIRGQHVRLLIRAPVLTAEDMGSVLVGAASASSGIQGQHVQWSIRAWALTAESTGSVLMGAVSASLDILEVHAPRKLHHLGYGKRMGKSTLS